MSCRKTFKHVIVIQININDFKIPLSHRKNSQRDTDVPLSKNLTYKKKLSRLKAFAIVNFRTFLNIWMLLSENERAKSLRGSILIL